MHRPVLVDDGALRPCRDVIMSGDAAYALPQMHFGAAGNFHALDADVIACVPVRVRVVARDAQGLATEIGFVQGDRGVRRIDLQRGAGVQRHAVGRLDRQLSFGQRQLQIARHFHPGGGCRRAAFEYGQDVALARGQADKRDVADFGLQQAAGGGGDPDGAGTGQRGIAATVAHDQPRVM
ncbi:hypothetical protein D3C72_1686940 [compost metagenome]